MSIIEELNKKYAEARVDIADAEKTAEEVLQKLESGNYIIYANSTSTAKFQINLETPIKEPHLAEGEIEKKVSENIFHRFSATVMEPNIVILEMLFYPTDRTDTPFDENVIKKIADKFRAIINNNMLYYAEQGESSGRFTPLRDILELNLYALQVFNMLAEEYRKEGISLQFGIELADEICFSWKPTDKEEN